MSGRDLFISGEDRAQAHTSRNPIAPHTDLPRRVGDSLLLRSSPRALPYRTHATLSRRADLLSLPGEGGSQNASSSGGVRGAEKARPAR